MTDPADPAARPRLPFDFPSSPGYRVFLARDAYLRAVDERLAPHRITYRQWLALAWLVREGGAMTQA